MIRAVFFDFDNTLFSHRTKCVPESAREGIRKLQERGVKCVLATGRHTSELDSVPVVFTLGLDGFVTTDGQIVLDRDGRMIASNEIKGEDKDRLLRLFQEKEFPVSLVEEKRMYINSLSLMPPEGMDYIASIDHREGEYNGGAIYAGIAYVRRDEEDELRKRLPSFTFLRWSDFGTGLNPSGSDKVSGIKAYMRHAGLECEEWMAFGDGDNDRGMLKAATVGVAMGNGRESVKADADYVTTDADDDGVWNALVRYGLV